ncbi:hypothetical protein CBR_g3287 [Chara braunii]|uniref:Uncharacterized protein n=1 Tax=Chara braunii TaxID=69332 RepID=A0A388KFA7_CHABU|nr:hypothetical protein CBR_g3287 [Chara braunii]|eukprot:GBG68745.1 hypothetical protein CBR_g3287 [Chara braunii]
MAYPVSVQDTAVPICEPPTFLVTWRSSTYCMNCSGEDQIARRYVEDDLEYTLCEGVDCKEKYGMNRSLYDSSEKRCVFDKALCRSFEESPDECLPPPRGTFENGTINCNHGVPIRNGRLCKCDEGWDNSPDEWGELGSWCTLDLYNHRAEQVLYPPSPPQFEYALPPGSQSRARPELILWVAILAPCAIVLCGCLGCCLCCACFFRKIFRGADKKNKEGGEEEEDSNEIGKKGGGAGKKVGQEARSGGKQTEGGKAGGVGGGGRGGGGEGRKKKGGTRKSRAKGSAQEELLRSLTLRRATEKINLGFSYNHGFNMMTSGQPSRLSRGTMSGVNGMEQQQQQLLTSPGGSYGLTPDPYSSLSWYSNPQFDVAQDDPYMQQKLWEQAFTFSGQDPFLCYDNRTNILLGLNEMPWSVDESPPPAFPLHRFSSYPIQRPTGQGVDGVGPQPWHGGSTNGSPEPVTTPEQEVGGDPSQGSLAGPLPGRTGQVGVEMVAEQKDHPHSPEKDSFLVSGSAQPEPQATFSRQPQSELYPAATTPGYVPQTLSTVAKVSAAPSASSHSPVRSQTPVPSSLHTQNPPSLKTPRNMHPIPSSSSSALSSSGSSLTMPIQSQTQGRVMPATQGSMGVSSGGDGHKGGGLGVGGERGGGIHAFSRGHERLKGKEPDWADHDTPPSRRLWEDSPKYSQEKQSPQKKHHRHGNVDAAGMPHEDHKGGAESGAHHNSRSREGPTPLQLQDKREGTTHKSPRKEVREGGPGYGPQHHPTAREKPTESDAHHNSRSREGPTPLQQQDKREGTTHKSPRKEVREGGPGYGPQKRPSAREKPTLRPQQNLKEGSNRKRYEEDRKGPASGPHPHQDSADKVRERPAVRRPHHEHREGAESSTRQHDSREETPSPRTPETRHNAKVGSPPRDAAHRLKEVSKGRSGTNRQ